MPSEDSTLISCFVENDVYGRHVEVCVRVVDGQTLEEEIVTNDKKRRNFLMGTSAVLFLHLDDDEEDSNACERLQTLVSFSQKYSFFVIIQKVML